MQRFIRDLSTFANICLHDLSGFRHQEEKLDDHFTDLQVEVKQSMRGPPKQVRKLGQVEPVRASSKPVRLDPLPPLHKLPGEPTVLIPAPFPVRHYSLRAQPCRAAVRIFRPKARDRIREDRLEVIDEYLQYPSADGAQQLDGRIDPILRVGNVNPNDMKWNGRVPVNVW